MRRLETETEIKYFILREDLLSVLPNVQLQEGGYEVEQRYFQDGDIPILLDNISRFSDRKLSPEVIASLNEQRAYARIRVIRRSNELPKYLLTIKGEKNDQMGRIEIEPEIDKEGFSLLKLIASAGLVRKRRTPIQGTLEYEGEGLLPVVAEIDEILGAGAEHTYETYEDVPFFTADVEFRSYSVRGREITAFEQLTAFRAGGHSFSFLRDKGVELTGSLRDLSRSLSMRYIAEHGLDQSVERAVAELTHLVVGGGA